MCSHWNVRVRLSVRDNGLNNDDKNILEVYRLANIKSAKKRILVNRTKAERNKSIKSSVKTAIKKVDAAVAAKDKEAAAAASSSYFGGSQSRKSACMQACADYGFLTLVSL